MPDAGYSPQSNLANVSYAQQTINAQQQASLAAAIAASNQAAAAARTAQAQADIQNPANAAAFNQARTSLIAAGIEQGVYGGSGGSAASIAKEIAGTGGGQLNPGVAARAAAEGVTGISPAGYISSLTPVSKTAIGANILPSTQQYPVTSYTTIDSLGNVITADYGAKSTKGIQDFIGPDRFPAAARTGVVDVTASTPFIAKSPGPAWLGAYGLSNPNLPVSAQVESKYNVLFSDQQARMVDSGVSSARYIDNLNRTVIPGQSPGATPTISGTQIAAIPIVGAAALGLAELSQGIGAGVRDWFSSVEKAGLAAQPSGIAGDIGRVQFSFATGLAEIIPESLITLGILPAAGLAALTQPSAFASAVVPGLAQQVSGISKQATEDPSRFAGNIVGMLVMPKVVGKSAEVVSAGVSRAPVVTDLFTKIPTAEPGQYNYISTLSFKNPFSIVEPKPLGYIAFGPDISGVKVGWGDPTQMMINQGVRVSSGSLFNVREPSATPTSAQMRVFDPFFRAVSVGTENEPIVSAIFDLKQAIPRSEANLKYVNAQPAGTFVQTGVDIGVQAEVHEVLAGAGAVRLGSAATTDWLGADYMRSAVKSDIDVDIPAKNFESAITEIGNAYAKNSVGIEFRGGGQFALEGADPEEHLISASTIEKHPDVRSMTTYTAKGTPIGQQTPEYGIESKASRLFGRKSTLTYDPNAGLGVYVGGKNPVNDLSDIYAAARGIAKTAYKSGYFDLGHMYEDISENLKSYSLKTGKVESIESIPKDILQGIPRSAPSIGSILGVGIELGRLQKTEYPVAIGYAPSDRSIAIGGVGLAVPTGEYPLSPLARNDYYQSLYPMSVVQPKEPVAYPGGISYAERYSATVTGSYPEAVQKSDNYPAASTPANNYVNALFTRGGYPAGTLAEGNYPVASEDEYSSGGPLLGGFGFAPFINNLLPIVAPDQSITYKRKRKIKPYRIFRELLPMITPREELGGFKTSKPFFRAIGNQQILELQPQQKDWLHWVDEDVDSRQLEQQRGATDRVSDLTGLKDFYRTATKAEKVKTGKPILTYTPTQEEFSMAKLTGISSAKSRKKSWKSLWV